MVSVDVKHHIYLGNFRVLCPCVRRKFVDWDFPATMLGLLGAAWTKLVSINRNTKKQLPWGRILCVLFELQRKGGGGTWIKVAQINCRQETAESYVVAAQWNWSKKWQHVCHYNPHSFYTILFTLFRTEFFQYPDAFKKWGGGVYLKMIHNKITQPMCY